MQPIQSWLFVPGHRQRMIDKAYALDADGLIFDLEDGVPPTEQEKARTQIAAALARSPDPGSRFVRVHAATSPALKDALKAVIRPGLAGLILPKVRDAEEIQHLADALSQHERRAGLALGQTRIIALIENAAGLVQAPAIAAADPRMAGLIFGAEDFALDLGADPNNEFLYARSALVVAAASTGLQAIDRAHTDLGDAEGLWAATRRARQLGFSGKILIHPAQIGPVHDAFCPTKEEASRARRIVAAFNAEGGSIVVDGRMIDLPVVEQAHQTLALCERRKVDPD